MNLPFFQMLDFFQPQNGMIPIRALGLSGPRNPRSASWTWKSRTPTIDATKLFKILAGAV